MKIAVEPDPRRWIAVPRFPAPGWARKTAELSSALADLPRSGVEDLERYLSSLASSFDAARCVRLIHIAPGEEYFVVDITLEPAPDDSSRSERLVTQMSHISSAFPRGVPTDVTSFRPFPEAAGLLAFPSDDSTQAVAVVRMGTSLPTRPVDTVVRLWGAPHGVIRGALDDIAALLATMSPLRS